MIYLFIATICFSFSFGLIKSQLATLPSELVVFYRLFIAMIIFLPMIKLKSTKKNLTAFFIGIVQFGIMYLAFIKAFKYLQGNEVALLTTTTPIFVSIWSVFLHEKFKPIYILCILLSVLGGIIVVFQNITCEMIIKGVVLMEISNCSFALGQVLWKKYLPNASVNLISSAYLGGLLFVFPFMFFVVDFTNFNLSYPQILSILYLGIVPTGLGFWLWNQGALKVSCSTLAIMNNLKIPFGVIFSLLVFHEKINVLNFIVGSTLILLSLILLENKKLKSR